MSVLLVLLGNDACICIGTFLHASAELWQVLGSTACLVSWEMVRSSIHQALCKEPLQPNKQNQHVQTPPEMHKMQARCTLLLIKHLTLNTL